MTRKPRWDRDGTFTPLEELLTEVTEDYCQVKTLPNDYIESDCDHFTIMNATSDISVFDYDTTVSTLCVYLHIKIYESLF